MMSSMRAKLTMRINPFILLALLFTAEAHFKCGTKTPPKRTLDAARTQRAMERVRMRRERSLFYRNDDEHKKKGGLSEDLCDQCIEIETYFHFITVSLSETGVTFIPHPTESVARLVEGDPNLTLADFTPVEEMLEIVDKQMAFINERYAGTPFSFKHMNRDDPSVYADNTWVEFPFDNYRSMSATLGNGTLKALNIYLTYTADSVDDSEGVTLGFAMFPSEQLDKTGDGVYMRYDTLTDGGFDDAETGFTAVHEIGHWLGLYHPWDSNYVPKIGGDDDEQDACDAMNYQDFINDTPQMKEPTQDIVEDCFTLEGPDAVEVDTCPNITGLDPVHNYMNYLNSDICFLNKGEFTSDQKDRMYFQWLLYRDDMELCDKGYVEIAFYIVFDENYVTDNRFWVQNSTGDVIYDSFADLTTLSIEIGDQETLAVDLCVPSDAYLFVMSDLYSDGFTDGSAEVFLEGDSLGVIEGDFGAAATIAIIPEGVSPPPVQAPVQPPVQAPAGAPVGPPFQPPVQAPAGQGMPKPTMSPIQAPMATPRPSPNPTGKLTMTPVEATVMSPVQAPTKVTFKPTQKPTPYPSPRPTPRPTRPASPQMPRPPPMKKGMVYYVRKPGGMGQHKRPRYMRYDYGKGRNWDDDMWSWGGYGMWSKGKGMRSKSMGMKGKKSMGGRRWGGGKGKGGGGRWSKGKGANWYW